MMKEWYHVALAAVISAWGHRGQKDKAGAAYWRHPQWVARMCKTNNQKVLAYLHDLVEDQPERFSVEKCKKLFGSVIADALDDISRKEGQTYQEYLDQVKANRLARVVKIFDLMHNMDLRRFKAPNPIDVRRVNGRYRKALEFLLRVDKED